MKTSIRISAAMAMIVAAAGNMQLARAHHSFAMFDRSQELVMEGSVVRWAFNTPHVAIYIENDAGELWAFEGAAPARMIPQGITGYTFKPGDAVTIVMCPLVDGRHGGAVGYVIKDGDEDNFDAWFRPNDGGCGPSPNWGDWLAAGYRSRAEAEQALGIEPGGGRGGFGGGSGPPP